MDEIQFARQLPRWGTGVVALVAALGVGVPVVKGWLTRRSAALAAAFALAVVASVEGILFLLAVRWLIALDAHPMKAHAPGPAALSWLVMGCWFICGVTIAQGVRRWRTDRRQVLVAAAIAVASAALHFGNRRMIDRGYLLYVTADQKRPERLSMPGPTPRRVVEVGARELAHGWRVDAQEVSRARACAIGEDGVWCFDAETAGPSLERMLDAPGLAGLTVALDGGCALTPTRELACWGLREAPSPGAPLRAFALAGSNAWCAANDEGTLGCKRDSSRRSEVFDFPSDVSLIDTGLQDGLCAATSTGAVWCLRYHLGGGARGVAVADIVAKRIASAADRGCAVDTDGRLHCWTVGDGFGSVSARALAADDRFDDVALSHDHACALATDGEVLCWGDNRWGQLGNDTASTDTPRPVAGLPAARAIAVSSGVTCAATADEGVFCWGRRARE